MQRDPFDKMTYESPFFDDGRVGGSRDDLLNQVSELVEDAEEGAPNWAIVGGIVALVAGAILLLAAMGGYFRDRFEGAIFVDSWILGAGIAAISRGVAVRRKLSKRGDARPRLRCLL